MSEGPMEERTASSAKGNGTHMHTHRHVHAHVCAHTHTLELDPHLKLYTKLRSKLIA